MRATTRSLPSGSPRPPIYQRQLRIRFEESIEERGDEPIARSG